MQSEIQPTYAFQGRRIQLRGDHHVIESLSDFFSSLYQGSVIGNARLLKLSVYFSKDGAFIPSEARRIIEGPHISHYSSGENILFVSRDHSSLICLEPEKDEATAHISRKTLHDTATFFPLVGSLLTEVLKYQGCYFLHGACVYGKGRAYLFSGDGGSGKTTAALSLVRQGFQYVSDDSLFFGEHDGQIVVSPFYMHFHVDDDLGRRFPEIVSKESLQSLREGLKKIRVDISRHYPDAFIPTLCPDYVVFPEIISTGMSSISPLTQTETYTRLLKQTILAVDRQIAAQQLKALEILVKQAKGFGLISGRDMYDDPVVLSELLDEMA